METCGRPITSGRGLYNIRSSSIVHNLLEVYFAQHYKTTTEIYDVLSAIEMVLEFDWRRLLTQCEYVNGTSTQLLKQTTVYRYL